MPVGGDVARWIVLGPDDRRSAFCYALNRGKRSVTLDLQSGEARALARRLIAESDAVIENVSTGVMERPGLAYPTLRGLNPAASCSRHPRGG